MSKLSASQVRAARRERRDKKKKIFRIATTSVVSMIALIFVISFLLPSLPIFDRSNDVPDGPGKRMADQGRQHIGPGDTHPNYNSYPSTSGWHYPQPLAPVRWGIHSTYIEDEYYIHNLEHGGIAIFYNCEVDCPELVSQLSQVVDKAVGGGMKVVMATYPGMTTKIALTAWNFIDIFDEFDEDRIIKFINSHESSPNSPEPNFR